MEFELKETFLLLSVNTAWSFRRLTYRMIEKHGNSTKFEIDRKDGKLEVRVYASDETHRSEQD